MVQSSPASLELKERAEEFTVLPFPPKKYTPDVSWNEQTIGYLRTNTFKLINSLETSKYLISKTACSILCEDRFIWRE